MQQLHQTFIGYYWQYPFNERFLQTGGQFIVGLCRFQHCIGHITTGSWKGRGNQYIQLVKVLYCKLLTNGKQPPAFRLGAVLGTEPRSHTEVGGGSVTTLPPRPQQVVKDYVNVTELEPSHGDSSLHEPQSVPVEI